jgi:hypothetical protein
MEEGLFTGLMNVIQSHPGWLITLAFLFALLESLAIVGIFVPGIVLLFIVGAVVGMDPALFVACWLAASSGALAGDGISYWLGRRFSHQIPRLWPLSRRPDMLAAGQVLFVRHGGKGVFIGRFHRSDSPGGAAGGRHDEHAGNQFPDVCHARLPAVGAGCTCCRACCSAPRWNWRRNSPGAWPCFADSGSGHLVRGLADPRHLQVHRPPQRLVAEGPDSLEQRPSADRARGRCRCSSRASAKSFRSPCWACLLLLSLAVLLAPWLRRLLPVDDLGCRASGGRLGGQPAQPPGRSGVRCPVPGRRPACHAAVGRWSLVLLIAYRRTNAAWHWLVATAGGWLLAELLNGLMGLLIEAPAYMPSLGEVPHRASP